MKQTADLKLVGLLDVFGFENILKRLRLAGVQAKYTALIEYVKEQKGA